MTPAETAGLVVTLVPAVVSLVMALYLCRLLGKVIGPGAAGQKGEDMTEEREPDTGGLVLMLDEEAGEWGLPDKPDGPRMVVEWFASKMEEKLREHDEKPDWVGMERQEVLRHLRDEVEELQEALNDQDPEAVAREAADVANLAMMLADLENYSIGAGPGRLTRFTVGQRVAYRPQHGPVEFGVVSSVTDGYVFVQYDGDTGAKCTPMSRLEPA